MAGVKELRVRIKSVGNIKQITRAMEMVASTKLRRFQDRAVASRPYADEISGLVGRLASMLADDLADRPLFRAGEGKEIMALVVSSDRGLCGAYNSNLFRQLERWRAEHSEREVAYQVYGRKAQTYMSKRGFKIENYIQEPRLEAVDYQNAAQAASILQEAFLSGRFEEIWILSTRFESATRYKPEFHKFLPIDPIDLAPDGESDEDAAHGQDVILEPDAVTIFEQLVPRYLEARIYNALLEALTSEYASRRFAMKNATEAANDMQAELKSIYNRKRQENITKELLDIVGGAEAVG